MEGFVDKVSWTRFRGQTGFVEGFVDRFRGQTGLTLLRKEFALTSLIAIALPSSSREVAFNSCLEHLADYEPNFMFVWAPAIVPVRPEPRLKQSGSIPNG